ncbi:response regulator transcription factor [Acuticoccus sp. MNP-M23]|uniref:response regulator transcription factor n=1 Tax=Acuticoccus sp. MNP-M23 TaxID=3072793 RepID=UPI002814B0FF|nr:response regulator transcription factor [Acuticoccus sp. MNP-M23]WMS43891.1 response regulator transcription factor [Acuticoccus sp. MNP-M23]
MSDRPATVIVVEDDEEIAELVAGLLRADGYTVEWAPDGAALDALMARVRPDLLILDVMLPGEDGLSICRRIRARHPVPILMLTAKSDEIDRVLGLEMGADDYVVKPFGPRELLARVKARLRRANEHSIAPPTRRYQFDRFVIDIDARSLATSDESGDGEEIALTTGEFDLLACFVLAPRRVLTRDVILDKIRGRGADPFDRTVDMLVSRLRRKLDAASPGSALVGTVRNGGYLFTAQVRVVP